MSCGNGRRSRIAAPIVAVAALATVAAGIAVPAGASVAADSGAQSYGATASAAATQGRVGAAQRALPRPVYRAHDDADGRTRAILPAGENGLVDATGLSRFEADGSRPAG